LHIEPLEGRSLPSISALVSLANGVGAYPGSRLIEDASGNLFGTTQKGGAYNVGSVFEVRAVDGVIVTLASFSGISGNFPYTGLVEDASGDLFGTTVFGGTSNDGTVFEVQGGSGAITTLVNFTGTAGPNPGQVPEGDLVLDSSGNLFGTTQKGGAFNDGTVFELHVGASTLTPLVTFTGSNGAWPDQGLTLDSSGNLFGTTSGSGGTPGAGTVFELQKTGPGYTLTTLAAFPGSSGNTLTDTLTLDNSGDLFGTTTSGGTANAGSVFELQKSGGGYTLITLASFSPSGGYDPVGGVVRDASGNLFGTTQSGGTSGNGTLFEVKNGSGAVTTLANFSGANGGMPTDGLLLDGSGNLFGTALVGGSYGQGTVFELPNGSSTITCLGAFNGTASGVSPTGLMEDSSGYLIGTAQQGGASRDGTVFKVSAATGALTTLATFDSTTGNYPTSGVIEDASGNLYGTTLFGGANNVGTIFELPAGSSTLTTLVSFTGTLGAEPGEFPQGTLALDGSGDLFGTTNSGGSANQGTVFELKHGTSTITTLATFTGSNGANPAQGVTLDSSGDLFGTTELGGGTANDGLVYELKKNSSSYTLTTLATFTGTNGAKPFDLLTLDSSGNLYGTTTSGGPDYLGGDSGSGTAFELQKAGSSYTLTTLAAFSTTLGYAPRAGVIRDSSGNLFGATTIGGPASGGTVFEVKNGSGIVTPLATLTPAIGNNIQDNLVEDTSGNLFGVAELGVFNGGSIFEVSARTFPVITTSTLAAWTAQAPGYAQTFSTSGGTGASTFASLGTLPPGLMLSGAGVLSGTPTVPGSYTFTATATDALGLAGSKSYTVTINPTISLAGTLTLWTINQPGLGQTIQASGGTGALTFRQTSGTLPPGLALSSGGVLSGMPTALGTFTVTVTATDSVGASGSKTFLVTVNPGAPVKLAFLVQPVSTPTGSVLPTVSVELLDNYGDVVTTDNTDSVTLGIASGPGGFTAGSTITATALNGVASFSNLSFAVPGSYTLSELVPQLYTGLNSTPFSVLPLEVIPGSFAGTPSGFSLQFNTAFLVNSLTPALYAGVPSVTLTQIKDAGGNPVNVPIEGSVIPNPATNCLTFLATNTANQVNDGTPVLPDGTYKVDVLSTGSTGIQAMLPGGGYLDGLASGVAGSADFTATFTVSASGKDVLWVPDTADGPLQPLSAPGNNQAGGGFPLYLNVSSSTLVTDVQVTLSYNPALLNVTSTSTASNGGTFTVTASAGTAVLHWSGPALAAKVGTPFPVGYITATVTNGSAGSPIYRTKGLLHLSSPTINGGSVPVTTSDGLHLVAYVGDANGDGTYSSADAVLTTRVALQIDSGFTAYPLVDPVIVADTDGSGFIPADAPLQENEAGVGFSTANLPNPPTPPGANTTPISNNVDPSLSLPSTLTVGPGGLLTVPVNLDDAHPAGSTGLIEAHLALTYNPSLFTVSAADVHLGSLLQGGGWSLTPTIDSAAGQVAVALSSSTPIANAIDGSLVTIDFHQLVGRVSSSINLVASVNINGQVIGTELEDAQGTFVLTPAPVNAFDPRIDGVVSLPASQVVTAISPAATEELQARLTVSGQTRESALQSPVEETTGILVRAPVSGDEEASAAINVPEHTILSSVHAGTAIVTAVPSLAALVGAAPLPSMVPQIVSTGLSTVPGITGLAAGQRLADQFFEALARATAADGVAPLPLSPAPADTGHAMSGEDLTFGDPPLPIVGVLANRTRRVPAPRETPLQHSHADQAGLDQYFAETADEAVLDFSDE
jgi:uncharacterized repeat protein (TIGR03803 family)